MTHAEYRILRTLTPAGQVILRIHEVAFHGDEVESWDPEPVSIDTFAEDSPDELFSNLREILAAFGKEVLEEVEVEPGIRLVLRPVTFLPAGHDAEALA